MEWKEYYTQRTQTAKEALAHIQSNQRVIVGHAAGEPSHLIEALVQEAPRLRNVEIVHMVALGGAPYCKPEYQESFRHNALFLSAPTREAIQSGRGDFTPCFFHQVPSLFRSSLPGDVALITVTPPNQDGFCSLGVSVDYTKEAAKTAGLTIAQVNQNMPFTLGESLIHVTELDYFVPFDGPIIPLPPPTIGQVEEEIGKHCASLIEDGDTLQLGIGAIPDAVLLFLKEKKDLGIHSEMFSDGVVELVEAGVITNARKSLHPNQSVATFLMGTQRLYDYVHNNPAVYMAPVDYVNHPKVISQNDRIVSINSCVEVDFMGQVNAEMVQGKQISGIGGQLDFVRGAAMAQGGISIIAMPSSAKGKVSKIVPRLGAQSVVTTGRCDVDYIVTEYGVASLKGKTLAQRAQALIDIAHPQFREELQGEFTKIFGSHR